MFDTLWTRVKIGSLPIFACWQGRVVPVAVKHAPLHSNGVRLGIEDFAGVIQLGRALALELAPHKIRVNAVCPGTVNTAMFQKALLQDGEKILHDRVHGAATRFRSGIPLRQIAETDDLASSILFLLSDAARHVTGQALFVDGGESII